MSDTRLQNILGLVAFGMATAGLARQDARVWMFPIYIVVLLCAGWHITARGDQ